MKKNLILLLVVSIISCNPDPSDPNMNCILSSRYKIGYNASVAPAVFDISKSNPQEIRNGIIEYSLVTQEQIFNFLNNKYPYPLNEYIIDSIEINSRGQAIVYYTNDLPREYDLVLNNCEILLKGISDSIPGMLTNEGNEISFSRYVIYEHKFNKFKQDSFLFIEFRNSLNKNYYDIINEFAKANSGKYDTVAIEEIINRTK